MLRAFAEDGDLACLALTALAVVSQSVRGHVMFRSLRCYVLIFAVSWLVGHLLSSSAHAEGTVDLLYDPETGSLTSVPTVDLLRVTSTQGLFTGFPTVGVFDFYEHFLFVRQWETVEPLEIGPVLATGLADDVLMQDLCVQAFSLSEDLHTQEPYDVVRLNGQVLHSEAVQCLTPPREFPPFTGERTGILQYNSATGDLRLRSQTPITALEIKSKQAIFTGTANEGVFIGMFDVNRPDKLALIRHSGLIETDFGPLVETGLSNNEFLADICVAGAWLGGGYATLDYAYPDAGTVPILPCDGSAEPTEAEITIQYDVSDGELAISVADLLDLPAPLGALEAEEALLMTTLDLRSTSGIFSGVPAQNLDGPFDSQSAFRILKQDREGFASVNFGPVLAPGLTRDFVTQDVTVDVTFLGGSELAEIKVETVPEPNGCLLLWAALGVLLRRRSTYRICLTAKHPQMTK
jgi:hypothetical protein